jgi:putative lipoprotein
MAEIKGTIAYRERIALQPGATVEVSLDRFRHDEHVSVSSLTLRLEGGQVPVSFSLPYNAQAATEGDRYGVRARILHGNTVLFESLSHTMITPGQSAPVQLTLVKASPMESPAIYGVEWKLMGINGRAIATDGKPPHIILNENGHDFGGNTGVNIFGGVYSLEGSRIMLDPQVSTMMAGSEEHPSKGDPPHRRRRRARPLPRRARNHAIPPINLNFRNRTPHPTG